ncbi:hypothetical protein H5410_013346 [Solanum commersonii]|uniref:Uncharacterized protein n=1 Tax=Solanum commersonii TaxID=4109 RepID=A0A9J6AUC3_SOLCO|nr:hypothetical protein H5410_013346 [Solanum commersonii]
MTLTIVTLQFHYGGCFVSDPTLRADLSPSPQIDRIDVCSSQPFDENVNRDLNQNRSHLVEDQSLLVEEQAPAPRVEEHSNSDSLYDVDENIDDLSDLDEKLLQARQSNIQEQVKEKTDRVNLDEIPSGPVGIDADFEDIYKEMRGRFEGNLGGDDPYFDCSDPGSDISEDEGDPVENDEVVDLTPRKETTKIYFDPTTKKAKLDVLSELGVGIEALLKYNKEAWCRAYFKEHNKCDVVENNMCETFNSWILDNCEVKFNGDFGFEIHDPPYKHVVDLKKKKNAAAGTSVASAES